MPRGYAPDLAGCLLHRTQSIIPVNILYARFVDVPYRNVDEQFVVGRCVVVVHLQKRVGQAELVECSDPTVATTTFLRCM